MSSFPIPLYSHCQRQTGELSHGNGNYPCLRYWGLVQSSCQTKRNYSTLQIDGTRFYYVDQATKNKNIDNAFVFLDAVKDNGPNDRGKIVLDLSVRIEGMVNLD